MDDYGPQVILLDPEDETKEKLRQEVVVVRVLIALLLVILVYISACVAASTAVTLASAVLFFVTLCGLRGACLEEQFALIIFWQGTVVWIVCFGLAAALYLLVWTVGGIAGERCAELTFQYSYGDNCTASEATAALCYATCTAEVSKHLNITLTGFSVAIVILLALFAVKAKHLAERIGAGDADDDDDEEEEGAEQAEQRTRSRSGAEGEDDGGDAKGDDAGDGASSARRRRAKVDPDGEDRKTRR